VIILDYMLPDVNGNIVCQTIKRNPHFAGIRIIIVSGVVNQDEIEGLLRAGAADFMKKPFDIARLVERIVELVSTKTVSI
jgi:two-component system response regulator RpaA